MDQMMLDSIGCTANMILLDGEKHIYVANSGDSRCVLARGGKAFPLSFDHKPDNPIEKKRIELAGSTITDGRVDGNLNLSRALGDLKYK
jgi:serine/threonine protein phosphatase PrpC